MFQILESLPEKVNGLKRDFKTDFIIVKISRDFVLTFNAGTHGGKLRLVKKM